MRNNRLLETTATTFHSCNKNQNIYYKFYKLDKISKINKSTLKGEKLVSSNRGINIGGGGGCTC